MLCVTTSANDARNHSTQTHDSQNTARTMMSDILLDFILFPSVTLISRSSRRRCFRLECTYAIASPVIFYRSIVCRCSSFSFSAVSSKLFNMQAECVRNIRHGCTCVVLFLKMFPILVGKIFASDKVSLLSVFRPKNNVRKAITLRTFRCVVEAFTFRTYYKTLFNSVFAISY